MFAEINAELKKLEECHFTGHVRFGVEHGSIMTINLTNKFDMTVTQLVGWQEEILRQCESENLFFGAVEFNVNFGRVTSVIYYVTISGESLQKRIQKCKNVRVVVKKLDS